MAFSSNLIEHQQRQGQEDKNKLGRVKQHSLKVDLILRTIDAAPQLLKAFKVNKFSKA